MVKDLLRPLQSSRALPTCALLVCALLTGCRHKATVAPPPPLPAPTPVSLAPTPEPTSPRQVQSVPITELPAVPAPQKLKKKKKKPVPAPVTAGPVELAANTPPAAPPVNVVGALSAGGGIASGEQQRAAESISEVEKRLAGLPAASTDADRDNITRVKNFLRQAHEALKSGDADGALTLATKAKVLLDDMVK